MKSARFIASGLMSLLMAACGGGGGGGGGNGSSLSLSLSPSRIDGQQWEGDELHFVVTGTVSGEVAGDVYISVTGTDNVFASPVSIAGSNGSYQADLYTRRQLSAGAHPGTLTVRLCADEACSKVHASDNVAFAITVLGNTNLTPLSSLGVSDWSTFQGGIGHSGYVPVTLDPSKFNGRWLVDVDGSSNLPKVSIADAGVYLTGELGNTFGQQNIKALDEYDGHLLWSRSIASSDTSAAEASQPTVTDTKVFLTATLHDQPNGGPRNAPRLIAYDRTSGESLFNVAAPSAGANLSAGAPLIHGNNLYVSWGSGDPIGEVAYDLGSGNIVWQIDGGSDTCCDDISLASDGAYIYGAGRFDTEGDNGPGGLIATDPASGNRVFQIKLSDGYGGPGDKTVISGTKAVVGGSFGSLHAIDLVTRGVLWSEPGPYWATPVVAQNVVYAINYSPNQLQARSLTSGALLWTYDFDSEAGFIGNPIATNNLIFVSTKKDVRAIDLSTHVAVWSYPHPGTLALSANGVLYIGRAFPTVNGGPVAADGKLAAINMH